MDIGQILHLGNSSRDLRHLFLHQLLIGSGVGVAASDRTHSRPRVSGHRDDGDRAVHSHLLRFVASDDIQWRRYRIVGDVVGLVVAAVIVIGDLVLRALLPAARYGGQLLFLPAVLSLIAFARLVRDLEPFTRTEAVEVWRNVHAVSMAAGSTAVLVGFLAGAMYLVQSWRLKRHRAGSSLRLPTLETLGRLNRRCLVISTASVGLGLMSGVVMNLNRWGHVSWTDRGVMLSLLLFVWLLVHRRLSFSMHRRAVVAKPSI